MVPLAPSHRNSVGIGLWYLEAGCGELQLGKNRICDGVAILAASFFYLFGSGGVSNQCSRAEAGYIAHRRLTPKQTPAYRLASP